ncbi:MAG: hypothetical protein ACLFSQ_06960 [Candidatus Zixiibacteriota bacterium]
MKKIIIIHILLATALFTASANEVINLNDRAKKLIEEGKYFQAIDSLEKAHPMDKNYLETYYNLGLAYQKLYNFEKALEYYAYNLRNQPDRSDLRRNLAYIYNELGLYDKSAEHLEYYISMEPLENKKQKAMAMLDSVQYRDSSKSAIVFMDKEDVVKHNEDDVIYYAFRCGVFYSDSSDTVLIFSRGDDIEKMLIVGAVYNGKRYIRATLPKKALVEYWLRGSRSHKLLGYYVTRDDKFFLRIQLEEKKRLKNPISGELEQIFTYKFYDVLIDKKGACWTLIENGEKKEPECFYYKNRSY